MLPKSIRGIVIAAIVAGTAACAGRTPAGTASPPPPTGTPAALLPPTLPVPATEPPSQLSGQVAIWADWGPAAMTTLSDWLDGFRAQHPAVTLTLTYYRSSDLKPAFDEAVRTGKQPTILIGPSAWGPSLANRKVLVDIEPRVPSALIDGLLPLAWSQASYAGTVTGLPIDLQGVVLYRNRRLAPQPPSGFDAWIKASRAVSDKSPRDPVFDLGFTFSGSQLAACGGTLLKATGGLGFDEPTGLCWLTLLARLRDAGPLVFDKDTARAAFAAGHTAWLLGLTTDESLLRDSIGADNLAIDPWPVYPPTGNPMAGFVWTENAYMIAGARPQDQDAAWALMMSLVSQEAQTRLAASDGARLLPVIKSVGAGDALLSQALDELTKGVAMPLVPDMTVYSIPLGRAVSSVAGQAGDPVAALRRASELIHNQLSISPPGG